MDLDPHDGMVEKFNIVAWSAIAPGLECPAQWREWALAPRLPTGDAVVALAEMPAMQRRRLEPLGRMALQVAWRCQPEAAADTPMVFASRHGDIGRTFEMLAALALDEPLSPTQFGLSTHNAIAAQYSIARGLTGNGLSLAAGVASAEAAVTEAMALLADGSAEVLVVVYDGQTPDAYAKFRSEPECAYAWAWLMAPARGGSPAYSLGPGQGAATGTELPHGLEVLRFFLAGDASLAAPGNGRCWQRHV